MGIRRGIINQRSSYTYGDFPKLGCPFWVDYCILGFVLGPRILGNYKKFQNYLEGQGVSDGLSAHNPSFSYS